MINLNFRHCFMVFLETKKYVMIVFYHKIAKWKLHKNHDYAQNVKIYLDKLRIIVKKIQLELIFDINHHL